MIQKIIIVICVFLLGVLASNIYAHYASAQNEIQLPGNNAAGGYEFQNTNGIFASLKDAKEAPSPKDRIPEDNIVVSDDKVVINLKNAEWASFTDTNSMDPILDSEANAIEIIPQSEDDIQVGDIVAYESEYAEGSIIHRIAQKEKDADGTYFVLKGDNNPANDPGKVRFSQIKRVVVAIIY